MPKTIALLADIHGNSDALDAVLADLARHRVDQILILGDHFSGPLDAKGTADRLIALAAARPCLFIRGNHDRWLLEIPRGQMAPSDAAAHDQLTPHHLGWLATLPGSAMLDDQIYLCHATPQDDLTYWLDTVLPDGRVVPRPLAEVAAWASGLSTPVICCAHTHLARVVRLPSGQMILNPGSVGLPAYDDDEPVAHIMQSGTPDACYATLRLGARGWAADLHFVPYDSRRMAALARAQQREGWAVALETGCSPAPHQI